MQSVILTEKYLETKNVSLKEYQLPSFYDILFWKKISFYTLHETLW